jgi:DNA-binding NarL/FixJ family response regulator
MFPDALPIARSRPRPTIVFVDDDRALQDLVQSLLEDEGYDVVPHYRWQDAHDLVKRLQPNLLLLDLCLGGSEVGWQVLDLHVLDPATSAIPVVLCSGSVQSIEARRSALLPQYGVGVLTKPFDLPAMLATLHDVLDGPVGRPIPEPPDNAVAISPLTAREREVAALVAAGLTNAQIADRLCVTPGTVRNHLEHILRKLDMTNRAQLAAWIARLGSGPGRYQRAS